MGPTPRTITNTTRFTPYQTRRLKDKVNTWTNCMNNVTGIFDRILEERNEIKFSPTHYFENDDLEGKIYKSKTKSLLRVVGKQKQKSIIFMIDISLSMQSFFDQIKQMLFFIVANLKENDMISIILFGSSATIIKANNYKFRSWQKINRQGITPEKENYLNRCVFSEFDKFHEKHSIGTYILPALDACDKSLRELDINNPEADVIILTDGMPNDQFYENEKLITIAQNKNLIGDKIKILKNIQSMNVITIGNLIKDDYIEQLISNDKIINRVHRPDKDDIKVVKSMFDVICHSKQNVKINVNGHTRNVYQLTSIKPIYVSFNNANIITVSINEKKQVLHKNDEEVFEVDDLLDLFNNINIDNLVTDTFKKFSEISL